MSDKFDELAKNLAQSVTRRGALKKFGVGIAAVVLASLGLANKALAGRRCPDTCKHDTDCARLGPGAYCGWCTANDAGTFCRWRCCRV